MIERIECRISTERSSGYDYLLWIARTAKELGLKGIVFNNDDGSIGIIAEGDDSILTGFSEEIKDAHPFPLTIIDNFFMKWHKATGEYNDFFIKDSKS